MLYVYYSLDSLRFRANNLFRKLRPSLLSWSESVISIFNELENYPLSPKALSVSEINGLCDAANDILARLAKSGENAEEPADKLSAICAEIFNEVYDYNEAVAAYNKKLSEPLFKAVAGLLRIKAPEKLSEIFFQ